MPKLLWKDGITTTTELTANAKVGIMFTIVVIGLTEDGKHLFENIFENKTLFCNMMECFQMLLSYWVWLKNLHFGVVQSPMENTMPNVQFRLCYSI